MVWQTAGLRQAVVWQAAAEGVWRWGWQRKKPAAAFRQIRRAQALACCGVKAKLSRRPMWAYRCRRKRKRGGQFRIYCAFAKTIRRRSGIVNRRFGLVFSGGARAGLSHMNFGELDRMLMRKPSSQPALLSLPRIEPRLDSNRAKFSAGFAQQIVAALFAPGPVPPPDDSHFACCGQTRSVPRFL